MSNQNENQSSPEHEPVPQGGPERMPAPSQAVIDIEQAAIDSILQPVASDTPPELGEPELDLPQVEADYARTKQGQFQRAGGMVTRLANASDSLQGTSAN